MRYLLVIFAALMLGGCGGTSFIADASSAKQELRSNSFGCLDGNYSGTYANGNVQGKRLRFPDGYDVNSLNADTIKSLVDALCD